MRGPLKKGIDKLKLARLQRLSMPDDEERIRAGLASLVEYACYDPSLG